MNWLTELLQNFKRLFLWFTLIQPWEQGIRVRLGKHRKLLGPGVHLAVPFIDEIFNQNIRMHVNDVEPQTLTTKDGRVLVVSLTLGYTVVDMLKLYQSVEKPADALAALTVSEVAQVVGTHSVAELTPALIEKTVLRKLQELKWGIKLELMRVTDYAYVKVYRLMGDSSSRFYGELDMAPKSR